MEAVAWTTASPLWDRALQDGGVAPARFRAPVVLRFVGDSFIEQLRTTLDQAPGELATLAARDEHWRAEQVGWLPWDQLPGASTPRLFQPAHNRFYVAAASLVCRKLGMPDHRVDVARQERVSFVVRRWTPRAGSKIDPASPRGPSSSVREHAWVGDAQRGHWVEITDEEALVPGEQRHGTFPMRCQLDDATRILHVGVVPTAVHDLFQSAALAPPDLGASEIAASDLNDGTLPKDERVGRFQPLAWGLRELARGSLPTLPADDPERSDALKEIGINALEQLVAVLLSIGEFLEAELPAVWRRVEGTATTGLAGAELALFEHLQAGSPSGALMLSRARQQRAQFESSGMTSSLAQAIFSTTSLAFGVASSRAGTLWSPGGVTLLSRVIAALGDPATASLERELSGPDSPFVAARDATDVDQARLSLLLGALLLAERLERALPTVSDAIASGDPPAGADRRALWDYLDQTELAAGLSWRTLLGEVMTRRAEILMGRPRPDLSVIRRRLGLSTMHDALDEITSSQTVTRITRALLEAKSDTIPPDNEEIETEARPHYVIRFVYDRPRCEPFVDPLISEPSMPYRMVSFFDADAPVRPIQIQMPSITDPAGFRRAAKGMKLLINDRLRRKLARVENTPPEDIIEGKLAPPPGGGFAFIWVLSIPIVTICALALLLIIVNLMNWVFWWLPFFRILIPIRTK